MSRMDSYHAPAQPQGTFSWLWCMVTSCSFRLSCCPMEVSSCFRFLDLVSLVVSFFLFWEPSLMLWSYLVSFLLSLLSRHYNWWNYIIAYFMYKYMKILWQIYTCNNVILYYEFGSALDISLLDACVCVCVFHQFQLVQNID